MFGDERLPERFWSKTIERQDGCWEWVGTRNQHGYGQVLLTRRKKRAAHQVSFEALVGPIPDGLVLDHLCRNHWCVNPRHAEPVTDRVNILRGEGIAAQLADRTHCRKDHEFSQENTYVTSQGHRKCKTCRRAHDAARQAERSRRYHERKAAAGLVVT